VLSKRWRGSLPGRAVGIKELEISPKFLDQFLDQPIFSI
jgi:hypothetical protein